MAQAEVQKLADGYEARAQTHSQQLKMLQVWPSRIGVQPLPDKSILFSGFGDTRIQREGYQE